MSASFANKLGLDLHESPTLLVMLLFIHAGALLSVVLAQLAWFLQAGLDIAIALSGYYSISLHALRNVDAAVIGLEESEGQYAVQWKKDKRWSQCRLISSFVHPWVVILCLRCPGRLLPINLVILKDGVKPDALRDLRARLTLRAYVKN